MLLVKNFPNQWWENWRGKPDKRSIDEKPPELDVEMKKENQKIIDIINRKIFQSDLRTTKKKPKVCGKRRDLVEEGVGRNKVLFSSQRDQNANSQTATPGFSMLSALRRQISGLLPASGSIKNQTNSDSSLLPHLACFVVCLIGRFCFCLACSWIVNLVIDKVESKDADIANSFSRWSLRKLLTIFQRCMTAEKDSQVFFSSEYLFYTTK